MQRIRKHLRIGQRWLLNGWQLFRRNPWLLGGMGLSAAVVLGSLEMIPVLGGLLVALVAPIMLSSAYLSLDTLHRQNMALPAELRLPALKQAPRQLLNVFLDENHLLPVVSISVYSITAVLLFHLLVRLFLGKVWVSDWSNLDLPTLTGMLAVSLLAFAYYVLLAASLIYALPLTFLRGDPLAPSLRQSLKASRHFMVALSVLLFVLLLPLLVSTLAASLSPCVGYLLWVATGSFILPLVGASLYCSYHDIFITRDNWKPADRRQHDGARNTVEKSPE